MEQTRTYSIKGFKTVLILPAIFVLIACLLNRFYSLPLQETLLFYVGILACFYIPGNLLLRFLDFSDDEQTIQVFHSIALGVALVPLVYITFRRINHPELLYGFVAAASLLWAIIMIRDHKSGKISMQVSYKDIISFTVLLAIIFGFLHLTYFTDVIFAEKGIKFRSIFLAETDFHLGIVNVLKNTFPPFYPYASGMDFSYYHLLMHIEIEMINRLFALDTIKLTYFYFPFLYFCLLVFTPYMFIRKNHGPGFLGVLTGILILCSDFSFIPGMLGLYPADYAWARFMDFPWVLFFRPVIWPIFCLNGLLPSIILFFLSVLYLKKYIEDGGLKHLMIFASLGFAAFGFKSSMGLQIAGSSFLTGIVSALMMKEKKKGRVLIIASLIMLLAMVIDLRMFRSGTGNIIMTLEPFNNFQRSLVNIRFPEVSWAAYPVVFIIYIVASFGTRALGFCLVKDIFRKISFDPAILFLVVFSLSGFILSEMLYIGYPSHIVNNSMWFSMQSLTAGWLLLSLFLWKLSDKGKGLLVPGLLVLLLSAPSTIQYLSLRFDNKYYLLSSHALEIEKYLERTSPESVVLHPYISGEPSLASNLAGRSSVVNFYHTHVEDMLGQEKTLHRFVDINTFFDPNAPASRAFILKKYKVDYVYAPVKYALFLDKEPELIKAIKNDEYILYRVERLRSSQK